MTMFNMKVTVTQRPISDAWDLLSAIEDRAFDLFELTQFLAMADEIAGTLLSRNDEDFDQEWNRLCALLGASFLLVKSANEAIYATRALVRDYLKDKGLYREPVIPEHIKNLWAKQDFAREGDHALP